MLSGVKCDKMRINLNDLARDARHLKRYVFAPSKVPFSFDPKRFLSFLRKTKPSFEFYLVLNMFSLVLSFSLAGDSFLDRAW